MKISSAEYAGLNSLVKHANRTAYIEWATAHYEHSIQESHMIAYGNLDRLNTDPSKYNAFVSRKDESGAFIPDIEREYYSVRSCMSPPPVAYGPVTNMNIATLGQNGALVDALLELRNETLTTAVKPFQAVPAEEHQQFHLDNPQGVEYPHSFFYYPVRRVANDVDSEIVASINVAHAWDVSMRKLLPETVNGIYCVLRNNCDQVFSFVIDGHDVIYLGEEDAHDDKYDDMELEVLLTPSTHPDFAKVPGHCIFTMVSGR